jgi:hypothetical protein
MDHYRELENLTEMAPWREMVGPASVRDSEEPVIQPSVLRELD